MSIIEVSNLTYIYGKGTPFEKTALDNISFSIEKGEVVCIIGHTGSGKSTLVSHLNGLIRPHSGTVFLDGEDIFQKGYNLRSARFKVGLVFQYPEYQLFEETVYEDIAYGPKHMGLTPEEIDKKFGFLVEAYKYGAPPHGGSGMGLDRLAMVMADADSLRDVIAFPKVQNASELMSKCPAPGDPAALAELGISVVAPAEEQ